ncbi:hypothetical protein N0Y54_43715 [Nostoc punctiforme UO1]|uniref:hypothetical protein n=1 Tax=Nostoc punctiforme TaxID=272131 RepID=UPI0030B22FCF
MSDEINPINNTFPCPSCGGTLNKSELESTMTDEKYICDNPKCTRKSIVVKTSLGQAAQVAPVVLASGVVLGILQQIFKNRDNS